MKRIIGHIIVGLFLFGTVGVGLAALVWVLVDMMGWYSLVFAGIVLAITAVVGIGFSWITEDDPLL